MKYVSNVLCLGLIEGTVSSQMYLQLPLSQYTNPELSCDFSRRPSFRPSHSGNVVYVYTVCFEFCASDGVL